MKGHHGDERTSPDGRLASCSEISIPAISYWMFATATEFQQEHLEFWVCDTLESCPLPKPSTWCFSHQSTKTGDVSSTKDSNKHLCRLRYGGTIASWIRPFEVMKLTCPKDTGSSMQAYDNSTRSSKRVAHVQKAWSSSSKTKLPEKQ